MIVIKWRPWIGNKMNIREKLEIPINHYEQNRRVGHSTTLKEGTEKHPKTVVIVGSPHEYQTHYPSRTIFYNDLDRLRGRNDQSLVIDNLALHMLFRDAVWSMDDRDNTITRLKEENAILRSKNEKAQKDLQKKKEEELSHLLSKPQETTFNFKPTDTILDSFNKSLKLFEESNKERYDKEHDISLLKKELEDKRNTIKDLENNPIYWRSTAADEEEKTNRELAALRERISSQIREISRLKNTIRLLNHERAQQEIKTHHENSLSQDNPKICLHKNRETCLQIASETVRCKDCGIAVEKGEWE